MPCPMRSAKASVMAGAVRKSMSATHKGSTSLSVALSHL